MCFTKFGSSAEFVGEMHIENIDLMEMPHLWKSAKSADSHELLGKARPKAAELFHIPTGPTAILPFEF
jgi:hypothetical protein